MSEQKPFYKVYELKDSNIPTLMYKGSELEIAKAIPFNECKDWKEVENKTFRVKVKEVKTQTLLDLIVKKKTPPLT